MGFGNSVAGVKNSEREVDHPTPIVLKSRKRGCMPLLPHISSWRSAQLFNHSDNFTVYLRQRVKPELRALNAMRFEVAICVLQYTI
jgi:hypothetical protein